MYRSIIDLFRELKGERRKIFESHYKKFVEDVQAITDHYEMIDFLICFHGPIITYKNDREPDIKNSHCPDLYNLTSYISVKTLKIIVDSGEKDISKLLFYDDSDEDIIDDEEWFKCDMLKYFNDNYERKIKWFEEEGFNLIDPSVVIDFVNSIIDNLKQIPVVKPRKRIDHTSTKLYDDLMKIDTKKAIALAERCKALEFDEWNSNRGTPHFDLLQALSKNKFDDLAKKLIDGDYDGMVYL